MTDNLRIPIVEEEAHILKRSAETERVSVRTFAQEDRTIVSDELRREQVEVTRVPMEREITEPPTIRTEGDVTIVPVIEERLVVEKRLFLIEELHLRRSTTMEQVEMPVTLRRTQVEIEREKLSPQEEY